MDAASWKLGGLTVTVAFVAIAIFRFDVIAEERYFPAKVVQVQYLPHLGFRWRAVLVDLGKEKRVIRTDSAYVSTDVGAKVCVAERKYLLRSVKRYSLALRTFCPALRVRAPSADGPPTVLPGD